MGFISRDNPFKREMLTSMSKTSTNQYSKLGIFAIRALVSKNFIA
jgi:hypothetical protein